MSAAPGGEWLQPASSAEAGFSVLWSLPETAVRLCVATDAQMLFLAMSR